MPSEVHHISHTSNSKRDLPSTVRNIREGKSASAVMKSMGLCRRTIYLWLKREKRRGLKASKACGRQRFLVPRQ